MADTEHSAIEALLVRAAQATPVPDAERFAGAVASRLRAAGGATVAPVPRHVRRRQLLAVSAAVLSVVAVAVSVVGPVRSAVADLLGVDGVRITRANPLPIPTTRAPTPPVAVPSSGAPPTTNAPDPVSALHLGTPTTLQAAARLVGFDTRVPAIAGYSQPDAVLVGTPPAGGMVSMIYLPRPGRPAVVGEGVASLLSEFRGRLDAGFFQKLIGAGTSVQPVDVAGVPGFWLSGAPHEFFYVAPDGQVDTETIRLAANTLLWSAGGITYRFESALSLPGAVAIADSMRSAGTTT